MNKTLFSLVVLTALSAPLFAGCSDGGSSEVAGESQNLTAADESLRQELANAIVGLETSGGEGDADPYKVTEIALAPGETTSDDILLTKLLPKLFESYDDMIPGLDETPIATAWASYTDEPNAANYEGDPEGLEADKQAAVKWAGVRQIFDTKLTAVRHLTMGYRSDPNGSLETGQVAHVFVGISSTGRLFAIWGIDVWT